MTLALNELWSRCRRTDNDLLGVRINRAVPVLAQHGIPPAVSTLAAPLITDTANALIVKTLLTWFAR